MKEVCPVCNETVFYDDADSADLSSERSSWWERHRTSAKHVAYRNRKGLEVLGYDRLPGMVGIEQTTQFKVLRMAGFGERRRATSYAVVGEQGRRVVLEREAWFPAWAVVLADVSVRAIPEPRLWEAATMIHRMRHDPDGQAAVLTTWRMTHRDSAVLDYAFGRVSDELTTRLVEEGWQSLNEGEVRACRREGITVVTHRTGAILQDDPTQQPVEVPWGPRWVAFVSWVVPWRSSYMTTPACEEHARVLGPILRAIHADPHRVAAVCAMWWAGGDTGLQDLLHAWGLLQRDDEGRVIVPAPERDDDAR